MEAARIEYSHFRVRATDSLGFLTYRCTSQCKTCNIWKRNRDNSRCDELNKEEWILVLSKLKKYGIRSFEIFGGDALLRKDAIFEIIRNCNKHDIKTYLPTNGNLCDRETVINLIEAGLYSIYLSVDDIAEKHDCIRGVEGTFKRTMNTLNILFEEKAKRKSCYPKVMIITTISNMNYRSIPDLIRYFENYPIDCIYPRNLVEFKNENMKYSVINGYSPDPFFVSSEQKSHLLEKEQYEEFKKIISEIKKYGTKVYVNFRDVDLARDVTFVESIYGFKSCHVATMLVTINPNGDVVPCPFYKSYVIGNLLENDLEDIWGNAMHREFIKLQQAKKISICQNCNLPLYHPSAFETLRYYYLRLRERYI
ncbi:MAG: radical SAM protein [Nitrospirae bacterium]|nr:radical SAM protein [Nitrospirota bacterium]